MVAWPDERTLAATAFIACGPDGREFDIACDDAEPDGLTFRYRCIWSEESDEKVLPTLHAWAKPITEMHIGGSMKPYDAHPSPPFSPFYIGLTEAMGGYNFGGRTAQLDLDQMRIA